MSSVLGEPALAPSPPELAWLSANSASGAPGAPPIPPARKLFDMDPGAPGGRPPGAGAASAAMANPNSSPLPPRAIIRGAANIITAGCICSSLGKRR